MVYVGSSRFWLNLSPETYLISNENKVSWATNFSWSRFNVLTENFNPRAAFFPRWRRSNVASVSTFGGVGRRASENRGNGGARDAKKLANDSSRTNGKVHGR